MGLIINPYAFGAASTARRYWRIYIGWDSGAGGYPVVGEMELRETNGGSDATGSGTAFADSQFSSSFSADKAFANDGDTTRWASNTTAYPHTLGYDFGAGNAKTITEVAIMGADDTGNTLTQAPGAFKIQSSNDNSTWTDEWWVGYPGGSNGHGYVGNTLKTFTKPGTSQSLSSDRHRYWRLSITGSNGGSFVGASNIEMRVVAGGPDETEGGTAFSTSNFSGLTPDQAFESMYITSGSFEWASNAVGFPERIGYDFGAGKEKSITEIFYMPRSGTAGSQSPTGFDVQYSDDNSSWTTLWSVSGITGWVAGTGKTFTKP